MTQPRSHPRVSLTLTTAAVNLPVSLNEVRAHMRVDDSDTDQDPLWVAMIRAATISCERYTRRSFVDTTWTQFMDRFPGKSLEWWDGVRQGADTALTELTAPIIMERPPLSSVTTVKTNNEDATITTVTASNYIVDTASEPGRIVLKRAQAWPSALLRAANGVEIEFVAGYGPAGSDVPEAIRQAILICVADMSTNREGASPKFEKTGEASISRFSPEELPVPARRLLGSYRDWRL